MRLAIFSDLHTEFGPRFDGLDVECDVAVLAGDVGAPAKAIVQRVLRGQMLPKAEQVLYVLGNHECYGSNLGTTYREAEALAQGTRVTVLNCSATTIADVRFLGCTLWTDFALPIEVGADEGVSDVQRGMDECRLFLSDYSSISFDTVLAGGHRKKLKLRPEHTLEIHRRERDWLLDQLRQPHSGPTVVVTHHAPHRGSLAPIYANDWLSTGFVSELPAEFFDVPVLWIHGHTHTRFDYQVGNCRVVCNPRGYRHQSGAFEVDHFDSRLVIDL